LDRLPAVATLAAISADFVQRVLEIDAPLPAQAFADSRLLDQGELEELEALLREATGGERE
jgi:predicted transcriptional regulator